MNPKVARFFPLAISALIFLREFAVITISYRLDIIWYFKHIWDERGFFVGIVSLFAEALKIVLLLGCLYLFKLLTEGKIKTAKLGILIVGGIYIFQGLLGTLTRDYWAWEVLAVFRPIILLAFIISLITVLAVTDPTKTPRADQAWQQAPAPVQNSPQPQSFNPVLGQSVPDQLAALEKLHTSGALSDAEFKAAKKKILE